jgi:hypothetical protein
LPVAPENIAEKVIVVLLGARRSVHVQVLQRLEDLPVKLLLIHLPHHVPSQLGQVQVFLFSAPMLLRDIAHRLPSPMGLLSGV